MAGYDWDAPEAAAGLFVNINGEMVPAEDATVSVFDRIFLYGDAVFDSFPVYEGKVLLLDRHIDRLYRSATAVNIDLEMPKDELRTRVLDTLEEGGVETGSVRIVVTRGNGPTGLVNTDKVDGPNVIVITTTRPEEGFKYDGISTARARTASTRAQMPDVLDPKVKTNNYLSNAMAQMETAGTDAKYSIMFDHEGRVAEAYAANVFVRDHEGVFHTPPKGSILGGLTRQVVMERGDAAGYEMRETELTQYDLFTAEDLFLTSSSIGIASIGRLDDRVIGGGEASDELLEVADAYFEYVLSEECVELDV